MRIKIQSALDYKGFQAIRRALSYLGPGLFITIGSIDPGNWATDIAAGSEFNYRLLWVAVLASMLLVLWQHIAAHLGIVTGKCMAEAVPAYMGRKSTWLYGTTAMAAMIATALAEIMGAAIGINLIFHIPIKIGCIIATIVIIAVVWSQKYDQLEKLVVGFVSLIGLCYLVELYIVKPDWKAVAIHSVLPSIDSSTIYVAMGVLGAVIMPHNIYLHSEVVQNRDWSGSSEEEKKHLLKYEFLDTLFAIVVGLAINAAMIIVAAAVFYRRGIQVTDLAQASETLKPLVGNVASTIFAIALLLAGLSSSMTAGIAGGTTFSGYIGKETKLEGMPFKAGMLMTMIPACLLILLINSAESYKAMIFSQVCLSLQLPFTMLPLFLLTNNRKVMGEYKNSPFENIAMAVTGLLIVGLNIFLIVNSLGGSF